MSSSDHQNAIPKCSIDPLQYMQIKLHSDGTITRFLKVPAIKAESDSNSLSPVLSEDFPLNPSHKTSVRIFIPKIAFETSSYKLPIIVYCHGGGFVLLQVDSCYNHQFCEALALHLPAIVVSVDYRLAPEHRLPAAYDDVFQSLQWIRDTDGQKNDWLSKYGDFDNCFLMGTSAGGNIAYHSALRALDIANDLQPVRLKGLILDQPFFGGLKRTGSEIKHIDHLWLPLSGNDLFWELGLPVGADRDHEFCNPIVCGGSSSSWLKRFKELSLQVLVMDCSGDPLMDRSMELVAMLKDKGVSVKGDFTEGGYHGEGLIDSNQRESLLLKVKEFVASSVDE